MLLERISHASMGRGKFPSCQRKRMGASDYHHSVIRTDDGSVQCLPQCLPAYERTHNHFIGQYSALFIWILVGMTNLVNIYFLLYISQVPLLILNEQTDQSLSVEIKSEFCVLCSCVYVPRVRERGLQTHSSLG